MKNYSLSSILDALTKHKKGASPCIVKRLIFNKASIGGLSSTQLILFFIALPFIEYAAIFNPYVFETLGIAQSIVVFIVFLVFLMQMVFVMIWRNNKKVLSAVSSSWDSYFPGVDLKLVLSSGVSPYNDFYKAYCEAKASSSDEQQLHSALKDAFKEMQEQNKELLDAINKDKNS